MSLRESALAGATAWRPPRLGMGAALRALWYRRSVRAQLIVIFILIEPFFPRKHIVFELI